MPLSSTLMFARRTEVSMFAVGPGDGLAEAIDRRLVVVGDRLHRRPRVGEQLLRDLGFFGGERSWCHDGNGCPRPALDYGRLTAARRGCYGIDTVTS